MEIIPIGACLAEALPNRLSAALTAGGPHGPGITGRPFAPRVPRYPVASGTTSAEYLNQECSDARNVL